MRPARAEVARNLNNATVNRERFFSLKILLSSQFIISNDALPRFGPGGNVDRKDLLELTANVETPRRGDSTDLKSVTMANLFR